MKILDLIELSKVYEFDDRNSFSTHFELFKKIFDFYGKKTKLCFNGYNMFITYEFNDQNEIDIYINKLSSNVMTIFKSFINFFFKKYIISLYLSDKYNDIVYDDKKKLNINKFTEISNLNYLFSEYIFTGTIIMNFNIIYRLSQLNLTRLTQFVDRNDDGDEKKYEQVVQKIDDQYDDQDDEQLEHYVKIFNFDDKSPKEHYILFKNICNYYKIIVDYNFSINLKFQNFDKYIKNRNIPSKVLYFLTLNDGQVNTILINFIHEFLFKYVNIYNYIDKNETYEEFIMNSNKSDVIYYELILYLNDKAIMM